jgi:hypothetical protein
MTQSDPSPSLYRQYFTPAERLMLDASPPGDLSSEIDLLRLMLTRVLLASRASDPLDLKTHAGILAGFSAAALVIARLVRTQGKLKGDWDPLWPEIEQGMHLARLQRGVYSYLSHSSHEP